MRKYTIFALDFMWIFQGLTCLGLLINLFLCIKSTWFDLCSWIGVGMSLVMLILYRPLRERYQHPLWEMDKHEGNRHYILPRVLHILFFAWMLALLVLDGLGRRPSKSPLGYSMEKWLQTKYYFVIIYNATATLYTRKRTTKP